MTESSGGPERRGRDDEWLVVRCQLGERPAFGDLIHRWHEPLWEYLRRLTGDDEAARDLAQDVSAPGWGTSPGYQSGARAAFAAAALGVVMLHAAVALLLQAHHAFARLTARRRALERELGRNAT
jgi:hypothetical protein